MAKEKPDKNAGLNEEQRKFVAEQELQFKKFQANYPLWKKEYHDLVMKYDIDWAIEYYVDPQNGLKGRFVPIDVSFTNKKSREVETGLVKVGDNDIVKN